MKNKSSLAVAFLALLSGWCYGSDDIMRVQKLLALQKNMPPVQFEIYSMTYVDGKTLPPPQISKAWQKGAYSKREMGRGIIFITRPDGFYVYDEDKDQYTKDSRIRPNKDQTQNEVIGIMKNKKFNSLLTDDSVDGKICLAITANLKDHTNTKSKEPRTIKFWIWKDHGMMIRKEEIFNFKSSLTTKLIFELKNFVFGDIPDSVFDVKPSSTL